DEGSILAWLPCGDKAPVLIVTFCFAVLGEVVVAEVCTTGLIAVEGVDAHELTEVDVVGNACCVFEDLVHLLRGTGDLNVVPEILAECADLGNAVLEVLDVSGHTTGEVQDLAELAVVVLRAVWVIALDVHQAVDA